MLKNSELQTYFTKIFLKEDSIGDISHSCFPDSNEVNYAIVSNKVRVLSKRVFQWSERIPFAMKACKNIFDRNCFGKSKLYCESYVIPFNFICTN